MKRLFVEKKPAHRHHIEVLLKGLREQLNLPKLKALRILQRYDIDGIDDDTFQRASSLILAEPQVDDFFTEITPLTADHYFAVEYLPGQFDQRADSAAQAIQILTEGQKPDVFSAQVYLLQGKLSEKDLTKIKAYLINPVDSHEVPVLEKTIRAEVSEPADVAIIQRFTTFTPEELFGLQSELGLAMSQADLAHTQAYFRNEEKRDPSLTEIRMLDTYWSDHCRHTTFLTNINKITFDEGAEIVEKTYQTYLDTKKKLAREDKPTTLMDIALIGMRELRASGELDNLEVSKEINAASIIVKVPVAEALSLCGTASQHKPDQAPSQGEAETSHPITNNPITDNFLEEEFLIQFKNETHNHPTEIEPFGGAATCLGGCIRDPLSGRSYVYQAMRVTGAANPNTPYADTIPGKLPQSKICREAALGYSSYGNQIGLATGQVSEIYHPGYAAKRMEIGAVVAAAPKKNVFRGSPANGDIILLIGGRTGRDGVGGATGSSKEHNDDALDNSAEVQKGNPPTERKIQRLFRHPELAPKIKICNDFGAGGVSVAIGEIADSLEIDLDAVPKKYEGLDGTELAISESQERMAVCVDPADVPYFIAESEKENLECVPVAKVTDSGRLRMAWRGKTIVDLSRKFLDTNGVPQNAQVHVVSPNLKLNSPPPKIESLKIRISQRLGDLNHCSQKGLGEMFDSTVGAATVLSPFGGKNQLTAPEAMVAKIPLLEGHTDACTYMAWGFDPFLSSQSPFHGAAHAVTDSVCKAVSAGARLSDIRLTLQEFFPKLGDDPARWGLPFAAILGAFNAQHGLRLAAIGGKDSMSGSFNELDVPPTLVSFALAPGLASNAISPEFKKAGNQLSLVELPLDADDLPNYSALKEFAETLHNLICERKIAAVKYLGQGGLVPALATNAFGNDLGIELSESLELFVARPCHFLIEHENDLPAPFQKIGQVIAQPELRFQNETVPLAPLKTAWQKTLEPIFPTKNSLNSGLDVPSKVNSGLDVPSKVNSGLDVPSIARDVTIPVTSQSTTSANSKSKPRILIPVFPGNNCEYDSARVFREAGGNPQINIFRNLTPAHIEESLRELAQSISQSQILMLPGGFSAGDEPDGSAKFIATVLRNPRVADAIMDLLKNRDGLILGICNGFQGLVKTGLLPHGEIIATSDQSATLTRNPIGRHVSTYVTTRVANNNSPWLKNCQIGDLHTLPISHGEGRFIAPDALLQKLAASGQIAFQYVDPDGKPTMAEPYNPNGSDLAIEALTSPCGRILGKMAHSERRAQNVAKNIPGNKHQPLFQAGVDYFTK